MAKTRGQKLVRLSPLTELLLVVPEHLCPKFRTIGTYIRLEIVPRPGNRSVSPGQPWAKQLGEPKGHLVT